MVVDAVVHSVAVVPHSTLVEFNGAKVRANIDCLEVEIVTEQAEHGTLVLRFCGEEFEAAKAFFTSDKKVKLTFDAV